MESRDGFLLEGLFCALQVLLLPEYVMVLRTWVSTISPYYFASTKHVQSLSTFFNVVTFFYKTGTEAMFADLGHFNVRAVQVIEYVFPILSPSFSEYVNTLTGPSKKDSGKLCLWRLEKLLECVEKIVLKRKKKLFSSSKRNSLKLKLQICFLCCFS
jgi:hypothetical protein